MSKECMKIVDKYCWNIIAFICLTFVQLGSQLKTENVTKAFKIT